MCQALDILMCNRGNSTKTDRSVNCYSTYYNSIETHMQKFSPAFCP